MNTARPMLNILAKIIELIFYCRNSKFVLPNHLIESLCYCTHLLIQSLMQFFSQAKLLVDYYTFLLSWLKQHASKPLEFPDDLCKSAFDSNQKIGKTEHKLQINEVSFIN